MECGGIQGLLRTIWGGCERFVELSQVSIWSPLTLTTLGGSTPK